MPRPHQSFMLVQNVQIDNATGFWWQSSPRTFRSRTEKTFNPLKHEQVDMSIFWVYFNPDHFCGLAQPMASQIFRVV